MTPLVAISSGVLRPTDYCRKPDTHLNIRLFLAYRSGYADQAIFGHLDWGVDFFAGGMGPPEERVAGRQLAFQQHMRSLAAGYTKLQADLLRRVELGWIDECWWVPRCPWKPLPAGTRPSS